MSMNLFFQAFSNEDIEAMRNDHSVVDDWASEDGRAVIAIDIGDSWDILNKILAGTGFGSDDFMDDVLFNGCEVILSGTVKQYADKLANWNGDRVLAAFRQLAPDDDSYHIDCFRDDEESLVEEFEKLLAFYQQASQAGLGVIHYAA